MIDTDKYEGHTEGPWELIEREGTGLFNLVMWRREEKKPVAYAYNSGKYTYEYPNAQLMADAPLLLAEVKRKTALADALWDFIEANIPHLIHQATDVWNNHNEEAIE